MVGEIVRGVLYANPRPAAPQAAASCALGEELGPPFKRGRGGPGGWVILDEPELHLIDYILVPDLAGWRIERMSRLPEEAFFTTVPDWVCEVVSPSTKRLDRIRKLPLYARHGVAHAWMIDPDERLLETYSLAGERWLMGPFASDGERVRVEPFEAVELELGLLWGPHAPASEAEAAE